DGLHLPGEIPRYAKLLEHAAGGERNRRDAPVKPGIRGGCGVKHINHSDAEATLCERKGKRQARKAAADDQNIAIGLSCHASFPVIESKIVRAAPKGKRLMDAGQWTQSGRRPRLRPTGGVR